MKAIERPRQVWGRIWLEKITGAMRVQIHEHGAGRVAVSAAEPTR